MKTALLHYWLTNMRGGEKVFAALGEMLPEADVFTHALGAKMRDCGPLGDRPLPPGVESCGVGTRRPTIWGHAVKESWISRLPMGRRMPQAYVWLMPYASRMLDLRKYELIVSSESGPIKGITKRPDQRHVCYCHSPMRYVWDMYDQYYAAAGLGGKIAMKIFRKHLQYHDLKSAESVDQFVANSRFIAERIKRIYGRESVVVHPPVDVEFFSGGEGGHAKREACFEGSERSEPEGCASSCGRVTPPFEPGSYYLYSGELRAYKRPDMAVEACARMGKKLVVIGNGKMRYELEKRVGGNQDVKFLGRVSDEVLKATYANAKALLFPGVEDFGIVPVEAQAAGTPVIALGKGGALDSVVEGETGLFYEEESVDGLCGAIEAFESSAGLLSTALAAVADRCRENAKRFSKAYFVRAMEKVLRGNG